MTLALGLLLYLALGFGGGFWELVYEEYTAWYWAEEEHLNVV